MSCIITYKGQKYSEEQFKEYFINNKQEFATSIAKNKDVINSFKRKMEGIDFVFNQSPELASIGSKAQYLQYLSTIFKTSQVKDIVYHGTDKQDIKFIKNNTEGYFSKIKGGTPNAIFFSKDKAPKGSVYDRKYTLSVILNTKNSYIRDDKGDRDSYPENYKTTINNAEKNGYDSVQILNTHDNFNTDVFVVFEPEQIHVLSSKADIQGFKNFMSFENSEFSKYGTPEVDFNLKATQILSSQKANQVFEKGKKAGWTLDKILTELQIPKEQKQLILDLEDNDFSFGGLDLRESIITSLLANYSYTVEINTAKVKDTTFSLSDYDYELDNEEPANSMFELEGYTYNNDPRADYPAKWADDGKVIRITSEEYYKAKDKFIEKNKITYRDASYYSNLTVPGGTNGSYIEANIETPLITPSIKGHSQFSTDTSIGWYRMDEKQQYQEKDIENLIEIMKKSGILEVNCG